jgi:hypothetical protein
MRKLSATLAVVLTLVAIMVAVQWPAGATVPPENVSLNWINNSGLCMGVEGGIMSPGTHIIIWDCDNSRNQAWSAQPVPGSTEDFTLRTGGDPHMCLSVAARSTQDGAALVIWDCKEMDANFDQRWRFESMRWPGHNFIVNRRSDKVIGVLRGDTRRGAQVVQWGNLGHPDQIWGHQMAVCVPPPC